MANFRLPTSLAGKTNLPHGLPYFPNRVLSTYRQAPAFPASDMERLEKLHDIRPFRLENAREAVANVPMEDESGFVVDDVNGAAVIEGERVLRGFVPSVYEHMED